MKKTETIKTRRLMITLMTEEQLEQTVQAQTDPELKKAYEEMQTLCREHPEQRLWCAPWSIALRSGERIGDIGFKGAAVKGAVEISYGLEPEYAGFGYMTEAVNAMTDWAFTQENVVYVEGETAPENLASQRILEKLGFQRCGEGQEGPRYRKEKPKSAFMSVYMCLGLSVGVSLGAAMGHVSIGVSLGICGGMVLGALMDAAEAKHRKEITA